MAENKIKSENVGVKWHLLYIHLAHNTSLHLPNIKFNENLKIKTNNAHPFNFNHKKKKCSLQIFIHCDEFSMNVEYQKREEISIGNIEWRCAELREFKPMMGTKMREIDGENECEVSGRWPQNKINTIAIYFTLFVIQI